MTLKWLFFDYVKEKLVEVVINWIILILKTQNL